MGVSVTIGIVLEFFTKKAAWMGGIGSDSFLIFLNSGLGDTENGKLSAFIAVQHGEIPNPFW
ncbi:MAG: hypothetical protein HQL07_05745 [Nitrospirae bacterium]|nr:hypothetical protein [Magnetococcales bacterium]